MCWLLVVAVVVAVITVGIMPHSTNVAVLVAGQGV
jgi:hypothetical protein